MILLLLLAIINKQISDYHLTRTVAIGYSAIVIIKHVGCVGMCYNECMAYCSVYRNQNSRPSTPEGERARIRAADHLERLQMTNPDERRSRIRVPTATEGIVPLNYGATLAAQIPQVQMPADWNTPNKFALPIVVGGPVQWRSAPMGSGVGMVGLGTHLAAAIPQVQLPAGWDAPLANPIPVVPPAPQLQRRGRGRGRGLGPLHDISGGQADPALNNLHRGHITLRERSTYHNEHVQQLQQQATAARQESLKRIGEERRSAEAAAARERLLQQFADELRERQEAEELAERTAAASEEVAARETILLQKLGEAAEETAKRRAVENIFAARKRMLQQLSQQETQREAAEAEVAGVQLQQLAEHEAERQAAAQQAALAAEPLYHDPPRHIDIEAALQERNRNEQTWIRRVHEMWRNEQRAEDQMQLDEQEELQRISIEDRHLHQRMMRLDQLANHMSSTQVDQYRAQVVTRAEQIQADRDMAAALAAEYAEQRQNELALRKEMECDEEDEDEGDYPVEYDDFGRVSPLQFPSSSLPPSTPVQSPLQIPSLPPSPMLQSPSPLPPPLPLPPLPHIPLLPPL